MKKIMIGALALIACGLPLTANAAPPKHTTTAAKHEKSITTSGTVSAWAADTRMLKLNSGDEFKVDAAVKTADYKTGQKVSVHWITKDGAKLAERVSVKK
jgi:Ni/Co efflux regulator RcnB